MGYIKEPMNVNLLVDPKPLTTIDKENILEIIAFYKKTGRKKKIINILTKRRSSIKKLNVVS